ncbi:Hypothetical protein NTJ_08755 [Nesidiocoris tenuis]|uniref:Uncharacterized protein n=1 Tax=Nesidiocoris tenuis TaxID=355587 RepID=A0ABN7AUT7_9HEMI|nr:Hypothetical protein NTJ_08755 [Nesidiocoris tenuis]
MYREIIYCMESRRPGLRSRKDSTRFRRKDTTKDEGREGMWRALGSSFYFSYLLPTSKENEIIPLENRKPLSGWLRSREKLESRGRRKKSKNEKVEVQRRYYSFFGPTPATGCIGARKVELIKFLVRRRLRLEKYLCFEGNRLKNEESHRGKERRIL